MLSQTRSELALWLFLSRFRLSPRDLPPIFFFLHVCYKCCKIKKDAETSDCLGITGNPQKKIRSPGQVIELRRIWRERDCEEANSESADGFRMSGGLSTDSQPSQLRLNFQYFSPPLVSARSAFKREKQQAQARIPLAQELEIQDKGKFLESVRL